MSVAIRGTKMEGVNGLRLVYGRRIGVSLSVVAGVATIIVRCLMYMYIHIYRCSLTGSTDLNILTLPYYLHSLTYVLHSANTSVQYRHRENRERLPSTFLCKSTRTPIYIVTKVRMYRIICRS